MTDEGLGQTTRAGRFQVLHDTVDAVFARLLIDYDVALISLPSGDDTRVQRLVPSDERCAPITVAFDGFPGVTIRYGRWYTESVPICGCDYCDDDADQLATEVREQIEALARTGFSEQAEGNRVSWAFTTLGGEPGRSVEGSSDSARSEENPSGTDLPEPPGGGWSPWPRRSAIH